MFDKTRERIRGGRWRWLARRPVRRGLLAGAVVLVGVTIYALAPAPFDTTFTARVRRANLVVRLDETGTLRPAQSITYRSPLGGRETEIVYLAPEGLKVNEGDLLARLDTTELEGELQRARQALRQADAEAHVADVEREEAAAAIDSLTEGPKALEVEEARVNLALAEKKVARLREEYGALKPLLEKGFITREELDRSALELEQAEAEIEIARKKAGVFVERTRPAEERRARLQLAQREAAVQQGRQHQGEAAQQLQALEAARQACSIYAKRPGLVVYEQYYGAGLPRKIRVGDRVTASQGLVTIPEVTSMLVDASVRETDVHELRPGQRAVIRVDAYPNLRLGGTVTSVGTLARASAERPFEEKRFDFVVQVDANDADLRPEMTVRLEIATTERKGVLVIPANAVFDRGGISVAYVVHPWRAETRELQLGAASDFDVEVVAGLAEGEYVSLTEVGAATSRPASRPAVPPPPPAGGGGSVAR